MNKKYIYILGGAFVLFLAYRFYKNRKQEKTYFPTPSQSLEEFTDPRINLSAILGQNYQNSGEEVRELQKALKRKGENIAVDAQFGPGTEAALKRVAAKVWAKIEAGEETPAGVQFEDGWASVKTARDLGETSLGDLYNWIKFLD